jgi:hypothetical protein
MNLRYLTAILATKRCAQLLVRQQHTFLGTQLDQELWPTPGQKVRGCQKGSATKVWHANRSVRGLHVSPSSRPPVETNLWAPGQETPRKLTFRAPPTSRPNFSGVTVLLSTTQSVRLAANTAKLPVPLTWPFRTPNMFARGRSASPFCSAKPFRTTVSSKSWAAAGWVWSIKPKTPGWVAL